MHQCINETHQNRSLPNHLIYLPYHQILIQTSTCMCVCMRRREIFINAEEKKNGITKKAIFLLFLYNQLSLLRHMFCFFFFYIPSAIFSYTFFNKNQHLHWLVSDIIWSLNAFFCSLTFLSCKIFHLTLSNNENARFVYKFYERRNEQFTYQILKF